MMNRLGSQFCNFLTGFTTVLNEDVFQTGRKFHFLYRHVNDFRNKIELVTGHVEWFTSSMNMPEEDRQSAGHGIASDTESFLSATFPD